jgi:DNA-binding response OmpR family regulator
MVKLVDTLDLKSSEQQCSCGFKSRSEYDLKPQRFNLCGFFYALLRQLLMMDGVRSWKHSKNSLSFKIESLNCGMKILIIEDETEIASGIQDYFKPNGVHCETAVNYVEALSKITTYDYDCILLDLMLPDGDGFDILKTLKKNNKTEGVIIISAKENLETRIEGFQLGADDYLTKPFHLSELLVRIQALIRRKNFKGNNNVIFNEIGINVLAKSVTVNNEKIDTTKKEIDLLLFLIGNKNKVLSKAAIAEHLSGDMADMLDNHDFVYAHIKNLKKKLSKAGSDDYIKTVYGLGYKWQND